jgi:hypothetical protein
MRRIIKPCANDEASWDQALALYRELLSACLDYLIQCGCDEDIFTKVGNEVRGSIVPDDFKLGYVVRTLGRNVVLHMRECDRIEEHDRFLKYDTPNTVPVLPAQERIVHFLRDVLEYSKRDTSLLIGITDAQADKLLSLARRRLDVTEGPSSVEIESLDRTYFRWKFTEINVR